MRAAHLLPLLLLAARASAGAPGPIDACAGGAAAINPNCGAGGGSVSQGGTSAPAPPGAGGGGGSVSPPPGQPSGGAPPAAAPPPRRPGNSAPPAARPGAGADASDASAQSGEGSARPSPAGFGAGNPLTIKAGIELQMGDAASACAHARQALAQDPKDAKASKIEAAACRAGLSAGPKEGEPPAGGAKPPPAKPGGAINDAAGARLLRGEAGGGSSVAADDPALQDVLARIVDASGGGDHVEVVRLSEEGLASFPDNIHLLNALATALNQLRDYKGALAAAERALKANADDATAHANKAAALGGLGDRKGMLASLRRAAELDPRFESALKAALAQGAAGLFGGLLDRPELAGPLPWIGGAAVLGMLLTMILILVLRRGSPAPPAAPSPATAAASDSVATVAADREGAGALAPGAVIGGYRVEKELGRGGMGVVYAAIDEKLKRRVAIKRLRRAGDGTAGDLSRFLKEAQVVAMLKHPNLAEIYTVFEEKGELLLVFEHVEGRTLDHMLAAARRLGPVKAARVLEGIASALDHAHERRVIHRDLKPSNVMVSSDGAVKLMDFGIAHQASGDATSTRTEAWGTPPYMAPEQAVGTVSGASDRYALAVIAYELVSGVRPFEGPDMHGQKLSRGWVPASQRGVGLPASLDAFFESALDPEPAKRPATAAELVTAFRKASGAWPPENDHLTAG